jgi:hypothetical protein
MTAAEALQELKQREPIFHRPELGTDFASMVAEEFWEIGASGKRYTKEFVLQTLASRAHEKEDLPTSDFRCQQLSADTFLVNYRLQQGRRITQRSTIWRLEASGWKIVFHQGTLAAD